MSLAGTGKSLIDTLIATILNMEISYSGLSTTLVSNPLTTYTSKLS
jgi:hypothetical protein